MTKRASVGVAAVCLLIVLGTVFVGTKTPGAAVFVPGELRAKADAPLKRAAQVMAPSGEAASDGALSTPFRDSLRRISNHITYAETTKELCDQRHPEFKIGKYTNLSVWEESQRLHGAKAFIAIELGRIDRELKDTLTDDVRNTKQWFSRLADDDLKTLCSSFLQQHRSVYLTNKPGDRNLLAIYAGFYRDAERLFPRYFTQVASGRWARADPVSLSYQPLPSKMSWWYGEIVENGRLIYAQKPETADNGTGYLSVVSDFIVLEADAARSAGSTVKANDDEWHRVEPPADGFTFEGEFTTYDTLGFSTVFGFAGRSSSKVFKFTKDGRFQSADDRSAFIAEQGSGAARTSKTRTGGRYRITGYRIELQFDGGKTVSVPFFPYEARTFASDAAWRGPISHVNLDGNLYLRSDS